MGNTFRPRGRLRHAAGLVTPVAFTAWRVGVERQGGERFRRLATSARDSIAERVRPRRHRMRALVARPGLRLAWRDVPAPPSPGPDGATVHPIAVATCDLDRPLALGATPFALPLRFGHECVAEVVEVGERVRTVRPGDRVVVPFQINCGICGPCRAGQTSNCASVPPLSMYGFGVGGGHWGGAVADLLAVPYADGMLVALPDGVDPAAAASVADNVSDAYRHLGPHLPELLRHDRDAAVTIVSSQRKRSSYTASCALYAGIIARALGATAVYLADGRPEVRAHAARLGLHPLRPAELRRAPPSRLVAHIGAGPDALSAAISATAPDGVCSSSGGLHNTARVPAGLMYSRNITLAIGRTHARAVIPAVLDLMSCGRLRPETVTTCVAPIDDAVGALRRHCTADAVKTVLVEP